LELYAGQIQPSEPTTEEYPGAEDTALLMIWDQLPQEAIRKSIVTRQLPEVSAPLHQRKRRTL